MPATSKAQYRFMQAVAHGGIKKKGLSKKKAHEFLSKDNYTKLPEKKSHEKGEKK
jgi:hypothetical protein